MFEIHKNLNVPNVLSFYRLISFPVVLFFALSKYEEVFAILLIINLITDALDGIIARAFNLRTEYGAKLDSFADFGMYITGIIGVVLFKLEDLAPHWVVLLVFIITLLIPKIISYYKYREIPSLHLYLSKTAGYLQGFFIFVLFAFGFNVIFFYIVTILGILAFIEHTIVVLISKEPLVDAKGLYWILKNDHGS